MLRLDSAPVSAVGVDEAAARRALLAQIARLERSGRRAAGMGRGPQLLSLGELERVRDGLATSVPEFVPPSGTNSGSDARILLEAMLADPGRHRRARVSLADLGRPGCGTYSVKPRLGLIGMLAGWWQVVLSSGCP